MRLSKTASERQRRQHRCRSTTTITITTTSWPTWWGRWQRNGSIDQSLSLFIIWLVDRQRRRQRIVANSRRFNSKLRLLLFSNSTSATWLPLERLMSISKWPRLLSIGLIWGGISCVVELHSNMFWIYFFRFFYQYFVSFVFFLEKFYSTLLLLYLSDDFFFSNFNLFYNKLLYDI